MQFPYDASTVEIQDYPPPFTATGIAVKIIREELVDAGLVFYLQVLEGEFVNREIRDQLSMGSSNEIAAKMGNQAMAQYCHVTGMRGFSATEQLFNIPFRVDVAPDKTGQYTNVKKRYDIQGRQPWSNKQGMASTMPQAPQIAYPPQQQAFQAPAFQPPPAAPPTYPQPPSAPTFAPAAGNPYPAATAYPSNALPPQASPQAPVNPFPASAAPQQFTAPVQGMPTPPPWSTKK